MRDVIKKSTIIDDIWGKVIEYRLVPDGYLHREDGPAVIYTDGSKEWWIRGNLHREDGPAAILKNEINGKIILRWYWKNYYCDNFDQWLKMAKIPDERKVEMKLKYKE